MFKFQIDNLIEDALKEDINSWDVATEAVIPKEQESEGLFLAKEDGLICGIEIAKRVFEILEYDGVFEIKKGDGEIVKKGDEVARIKGNTRAILMGERTALNILQHLSGIATRTRMAVNMISNHTKILDTRKTLPGLRLLQKYAVKVGGGENHRYNLSQAAMLKDNHIKAVGGVKKAVEEARKNLGPMVAIEVEVSNIEELKEALETDVNMIMLDNMDTKSMREAVEITNKRVALEASGNMTLERLIEVSETGVDYISIGALTHSVKALDISLKID